MKKILLKKVIAIWWIIFISSIFSACNFNTKKITKENKYKNTPIFYTTWTLKITSYPAWEYTKHKTNNNPFFIKYQEQEKKFINWLNWINWIKKEEKNIKKNYYNDNYEIIYEKKENPTKNKYKILKNNHKIYEFSTNKDTKTIIKNFVVNREWRRLLYENSETTKTEHKKKSILINNWENLSEKNWRTDIFNLQKFGNEQIFFFFKDPLSTKNSSEKNKVKYYFDKNKYNTNFDEIIHGECCEAKNFNIKSYKNGKIIFWGKIGSNFSYNQAILKGIVKEEDEKKNIDRTNIQFTKCDNLRNYHHTVREKKWYSQKVVQDFEKRIEKEIDLNKVNNNQWVEQSIGRNGNIYEYCISKDWKKIIWYGYGKSPNHFVIRNKEKDFLQLAIQKRKIWPNRIESPRRLLYRYNQDKLYKKYLESKKYIQGFWKKRWSHIAYVNYWLRSIEPSDRKEKNFPKKSTLQRCYHWITKNNKPAVCFINEYYDRELNRNIIKEKKICIYSFNSKGEVYPVEPCKEN